MPTSSASRSSTPSIANWAWLAPKPAERAAHRVVGADGDGLDVDRPARGTGPLAWPAARSSTFMPDRRRRRRESPTPRTRSAVSLPSASHPAQYSRRIGWRLGCISRLSSRDSVHFTGRSSSHAASAVCAWLLMSSLPPNAPPFDTSSTVDPRRCRRRARGRCRRGRPTRPGRPSTRAACRSSPSTAARRASTRARGRRARCAGSGTPRARRGRWPRARRRRRRGRTSLTRQHVAVGAPHRDRRAVVERGDRVGDGRQHVVGDVDELGRGPGLLAGLGDDDGEHVAGVATCARRRGSSPASPCG